MIVIDASALAAYILREEGFQDIKEYLLLGVHSIDLVYAEVTNAIYIAYKRKRINKEYADIALKALMELYQTIITIENHIPLLEDAYRLSLKYNTPIYDTLYIALARRGKGKLLTKDKKQAEIAKHENIEVILIP